MVRGGRVLSEPTGGFVADLLFFEGGVRDRGDELDGAGYGVIGLPAGEEIKALSIRELAILPDFSNRYQV